MEGSEQRLSIRSHTHDDDVSLQTTCRTCHVIPAYCDVFLYLILGLMLYRYYLVEIKDLSLFGLN